MVAVILVSFIVSISQRFKTGSIWMLLIMVVQVCLGISALVLQVPLALGAAHQAGAVALLSACLYSAHKARKSQTF